MIDSGIQEKTTRAHFIGVDHSRCNLQTVDIVTNALQSDLSVSTTYHSVITENANMPKGQSRKYIQNIMDQGGFLPGLLYYYSGAVRGVPYTEIFIQDLIDEIDQVGRENAVVKGLIPREISLRDYYFSKMLDDLAKRYTFDVQSEGISPEGLKNIERAAARGNAFYQQGSELWDGGDFQGAVSAFKGKTLADRVRDGVRDREMRDHLKECIKPIVKRKESATFSLPYGGFHGRMVSGLDGSFPRGLVEVQSDLYSGGIGFDIDQKLESKEAVSDLEYAKGMLDELLSTHLNEVVERDRRFDVMVNYYLYLRRIHESVLGMTYSEIQDFCHQHINFQDYLRSEILH